MEIFESLKETRDWRKHKRILNCFQTIEIESCIFCKGFHTYYSPPPGTHRPYVELGQRRPLGRRSWQVKCLIVCSTPGVPPVQSRASLSGAPSTCMEYSVASVAVPAVDHRARRPAIASSIRIDTVPLASSRAVPARWALAAWPVDVSWPPA